MLVEYKDKRVKGEARDFAASMIMAAGGTLHRENQGMVNREIIEMVTGISDANIYSFMLYNNAYQLLA